MQCIDNRITDLSLADRNQLTMLVHLDLGGNLYGINYQQLLQDIADRRGLLPRRMWKRKCEVHDKHIQTLNINHLESKIEEVYQMSR